MILLRLLLSSQTVMTSDHQTEKLQEKILEVMCPLSRSWKGLEDIRKAPSDETVEVPVGKFVTLVEQVILLVGQASVSVSYTRRFNILKMIMKDPRKAKGTWEYFEGKENSPPWKKVSISCDRDKKIYKEVTGSL